jgi:hypothetical protein
MSLYVGRDVRRRSAFRYLGHVSVGAAQGKPRDSRHLPARQSGTSNICRYRAIPSSGLFRQFLIDNLREAGESRSPAPAFLRWLFGDDYNPRRLR